MDQKIRIALEREREMGNSEDIDFAEPLLDHYKGLLAKFEEEEESKNENSPEYDVRKKLEYAEFLKKLGIQIQQKKNIKK
jgi:hypothetical protein